MSAANFDRNRDAARIARDAPDVAEQVKHFGGAIPPASVLTEILRTIDDAALRTGVMIERGDYKLISQPDGNVGQYVLSIPVKGDYSATQAFCGRLLTEMPTLSLDRVVLSRQSATELTVEASLTFTLFYRFDDRLEQLRIGGDR